MRPFLPGGTILFYETALSELSAASQANLASHRDGPDPIKSCLLSHCRFSCWMAPEAAVSCGPAGFLVDLSAGFFSLVCRFPRWAAARRGGQLRGGVQQGAEPGLGEAVVDGAALCPAGNQAGLPEPDQVGGDVGLGAAQLGGEAGDALFPGLQGEQDISYLESPRRALV